MNNWNQTVKVNTSVLLHYPETHERIEGVMRWGLEKLAGDDDAYFTVQGELKVWDDYDSSGYEYCGRCDDIITKGVPWAAPLLAIQCSTWRGVPLYPVVSGLYFIGGMVLGIGEMRFRAGNGRHAKPPEECAKLAAAHFRCSLTEAWALAEPIRLFRDERNAYERAEKWVRKYCEDQKPRWQAEADVCCELITRAQAGDPTLLVVDNTKK